jgi:hypothetical protein
MAVHFLALLDRSANAPGVRRLAALVLAACGIASACGRVGFAPTAAEVGGPHDPTGSDAGAAESCAAGAAIVEVCGPPPTDAGSCTSCEPGESESVCVERCVICGDGLLDPGETCDPPDECPTSATCIASDSCMVATLEGEPASCNARCSIETIEVCADADQCCPVGCNAVDDGDCSASCGNGAVEPGAGETCEMDSELPCPESCDDGDVCTEDLLSGSLANCNAACAHIAISMPRPEDGCCPPGAHSLQDPDCPPVCGNGVPEAAESCDPCPTNCADTDACTLDTLAGSATDCSAVCMHGPITSPAGGDGCCPPGANTTTDSDCSPSCGNGSVEAGEDCDGGELCRTNCTLRFHPSLTHRYALDGPATGSASRIAVDSIGGRNGSVSGDALDGDGKLTLAGGNNGGFVDLPNGLLSALNDVTVEVWVRWNGGADNQEIFDFGMNSAGEGSASGNGTSFFFVSPSGLDDKLAACLNATDNAGDISASERIDATSSLPTGQIWHVAVTFEDPGASARKTMKLYRNGVLVAGADDNVPARTGGADNRLSSVDDRNSWIGRANYPVSRLAGVVYEFRIYNQALSGADVAASSAAGPNPGP